MDPATAMGPLQNKPQLAKVKALVDAARAERADALCGGEAAGTGYFYPATIIGDARDGMRVVDGEQFGPVLPVIRYTFLDDAITSAKGLEYGLAASVWSFHPERALGVARRLEAGTVYVNSHADVASNIPFGGIKQSGIGVELGQAGMEAYTNITVYRVARR